MFNVIFIYLYFIYFIYLMEYFFVFLFIYFMELFIYLFILRFSLLFKVAMLKAASSVSIMHQVKIKKKVMSSFLLTGSKRI